MSDVASQLLMLNKIKQDKKALLIERGVDMKNVPFTEYPDEFIELMKSNTGIKIITGTIHVPLLPPSKVQNGFIPEIEAPILYGRAEIIALS